MSLKIVSINYEYSTDAENVAFNIENAPTLISQVQYGKLSVRIENGLLHVAVPPGGELLNNQTIETIEKKFSDGESEAKKAADEITRQKNLALKRLSKSTGLPIDWKDGDL